MDNTTSEPIRLASLAVKKDRVVARVVISDERYRYTTPHIADLIGQQFPTLAMHACVNATGKTFGHVMECTSMAHLLEHLVIELQTRACENEAAVFTGTSEWLDEAAGVACVQVSFKDDLEALRAFNNATHFLNTAVLV